LPVIHIPWEKRKKNGNRHQAKVGSQIESDIREAIAGFQGAPPFGPRRAAGGIIGCSRMLPAGGQ
jgi:hypothetical protein